MMTNFLETVQNFRSLKILVVGDLMLDHYITGSTERTSPEAPVPVVLVSAESYLPGGAANVARNIAAAGGKVLCCGVVGADEAGRLLVAKLSQAGVDVEGIISQPCATIVKTRVVSQGQQIVRLDREKPVTLAASEVEAMMSFLISTVPQVDSVIISDYGKGLLSPELLNPLLALCTKNNVPVFVDPKGRDYARYHGTFAITPNSREAQDASDVLTGSEEGLARAAEKIHNTTGCEIVVITRGSEGLALRDGRGQMQYVPTSAREVFDVTGAGDTFVAWLTLGVAAKLDPAEAATLANIAAGISVSRTGPATVSPFDLRQALAPGRLGKKIVAEADLPDLGQQLKTEGKRIVLANGCFDFLHAGHVAFLQEAKALGDVLVVATNTDATIRKLKGDPRPIIAQKQREELLASIEAVDYVTVFTHDTPHDLITQLRPDVLVKGSNYTQAQIEGAELVIAAGGQALTLLIQHDFHTAQLVTKN